jgi:hypothetical protein
LLWAITTFYGSKNEQASPNFGDILGVQFYFRPTYPLNQRYHIVMPILPGHRRT